ncbi:hypothetical protein PCE1_003566 [Barthelona sp. PCE]
MTNETAITLKGSTEIVSEFFTYSINSILFLRGIYPPENFRVSKQYGLSLWLTTDTGLETYLTQILEQIKDWLSNGVIKSLVAVISSCDTTEPLERWVFEVETDQSYVEDPSKVAYEKDVRRSIQNIMRQISASTSFLPLLEDACVFDLLVYTDNDVEIPMKWNESDPCYISSSTEVRLRSFTTRVHKVATTVSYKSEF